MAAAEFGTVEEREVELFRWRLDELLGAGYALDDALTLTTEREVDLHLAVDLPQRGCPHATAVRTRPLSASCYEQPAPQNDQRDK